MNITFYAILIWTTAIIITSLDLVILIGSKNISSRFFVFLTFLTALWVASQGFLVSTTSPVISNELLRIQYILGISIAVGFYHFSTIYPYDRRASTTTILFSILLIAAFTYLYIFTNSILAGVIYIGGIGNWAWTFGPWHLLFEMAFCCLWIVALSKIYITYKKSSGDLRPNLRNMFYGLFFGIIPPTVVNILLPTFGVFSLNWIGPISSSIWIFIIGYSIIRYRQMNIRTVVTEVFAIAMTAIFFVNIFIDVPFGVGGRMGTFIIFLIIVYYLIRSALRESRQKEELSNLNLHLSEKVAEQTLEIRKAFELEKKAHRELEKLNETKDQFIMITQHHLRTPVTSIRWNIEEMLKGTYGKFQVRQKKALESTYTAVSRLMRIVDDFLSITALKVGSQILNITPTSPLPLLEDVLSELHLDIEEKKLKVSYPKDFADWPELPIDASKVRETILIIVENAVRYNINSGLITIKTSVHDDSFEMTIENTGIGISPEEHKKLFTSLFYRGDSAKSAHPIGMGVGLSVSRAIIRAHHGELTITSAGKGKGAKVIVILPLTRDVS